jgi:hypothetical protein
MDEPSPVQTLLFLFFVGVLSFVVTGGIALMITNSRLVAAISGGIGFFLAPLAVTILWLVFGARPRS